MTWEEVCDDPCLQDLPYRIELNQRGNIEMTRVPPVWHGEMIARISCLLYDLMSDGIASTITAVDTAENTKVVDVVWISHERCGANPSEHSYSPAPEICVEVFTPADSLEEQAHRGHLYLQAGAEEFWLCDKQGSVRFFGSSGLLERSRLCPEFPARVEFRR